MRELRRVVHGRVHVVEAVAKANNLAAGRYPTMFRFRTGKELRGRYDYLNPDGTESGTAGDMILYMPPH